MSNPDKYIEQLIKILSFPALSKQEKERADFMEEFLREQGYTVQRIHHNLLVTTDGKMENKRILLNSHIDTVSPSAGWETDPFVPILKNDKIIGLGSNDAGASVVSLIAAFETHAKLNGGREIALLLSCEEEVSGPNGMARMLPYLRDISFAIVGEPTGMNPAVAERGLMVIDGLATGKSGHAARNEGINAIYMVMEDIRSIRNLKFSNASEWLPDPVVNVTMINAGTNHNVVPGECRFVIDARSNDQYPNVKLLEILKGCCETEIVPRSLRLNSSSLDKQHPVFRVLKDLGMQPFGSSTMSDMALIPFPAIKIGPGDSARSHTAGEYILTGEIEDAIPTYVKLIDGILKTKI